MDALELGDIRTNFHRLDELLVAGHVSVDGEAELHALLQRRPYLQDTIKFSGRTMGVAE